MGDTISSRHIDFQLLSHCLHQLEYFSEGEVDQENDFVTATEAPSTVPRSIQATYARMYYLFQ